MVAETARRNGRNSAETSKLDYSQVNEIKNPERSLSRTTTTTTTMTVVVMVVVVVSLYLENGEAYSLRFYKKKLL